MKVNVLQTCIIFHTHILYLKEDVFSVSLKHYIESDTWSIFLKQNPWEYLYFIFQHYYMTWEWSKSINKYSSALSMPTF